jgi:hypothetical protein
MFTNHRNFSMRYFGIVLLCLVAGLGIFGCGSSAGNLATGRYVGNFTTSTGQTGAAYMSVASDGTITGTAVNTTTAIATPLSGTRTGASQTVLTIGGNTLTGPLTANSSNELTGVLTSSSSGGGTTTFTLNAALGGSTPLYAGSLTGSFTTNSGDSGNLTLIVDPNGNVTGLFVDTTKNTTSTLSGTITNGGVVNLTPNTGVAVTGTLVIETSGQVIGTLAGPAGSTIIVALVQA